MFLSAAWLFWKHLFTTSTVLVATDCKGMVSLVVAVNTVYENLLWGTLTNSSLQRHSHSFSPPQDSLKARSVSPQLTSATCSYATFLTAFNDCVLSVLPRRLLVPRAATPWRPPATIFWLSRATFDPASPAKPASIVLVPNSANADATRPQKTNRVVCFYI